VVIFLVLLLPVYGVYSYTLSSSCGVVIVITEDGVLLSSS
jgi:hypothetical protein